MSSGIWTGTASLHQFIKGTPLLHVMRGHVILCDTSPCHVMSCDVKCVTMVFLQNVSFVMNSFLGRMETAELFPFPEGVCVCVHGVHVSREDKRRRGKRDSLLYLRLLLPCSTDWRAETELEHVHWPCHQVFWGTFLSYLTNNLDGNHFNSMLSCSQLYKHTRRTCSTWVSKLHSTMFTEPVWPLLGNI